MGFMQANKCGVPLLGWTFQTCLFTLKQWEAMRNPPTRQLCPEGRTKDGGSVLPWAPEAAALGQISALAGKGQKPRYKLCFQSSVLLSKKWASKVLIGPPKINPFNERIHWFRTQTWENQRKQMSWAMCFEKIDPWRAIPLLVCDPGAECSRGCVGASHSAYKWVTLQDKGLYSKLLEILRNWIWKVTPHKEAAHRCSYIIAQRLQVAYIQIHCS